jgi:hypothetical protein
MESNALPVVAALGTVLAIVHLLRRRRLREKYALLWLVVATGVVVIAAVPAVLTVAADLLGVQTPSNLLFFVAALVLLIVSVQLSAEVSRLEDETRCLAEEVALLRLDVERTAAP